MSLISDAWASLPLFCVPNGNRERFLDVYFHMQCYSYSVTVLEALESEAIEVELESEEVGDYGTYVARAMLSTRPDLKYKGMCVVMYDTQGQAITIVPIDPLH
jgi:hypothetical protein